MSTSRCVICVTYSRIARKWQIAILRRAEALTTMGPGYCWDTKREAVDRARTLARMHRPSRLAIYKRNGSEASERLYDAPRRERVG